MTVEPPGAAGLEDPFSSSRRARRLAWGLLALALLALVVTRSVGLWMVLPPAPSEPNPTGLALLGIAAAAAAALAAALPPAVAAALVAGLVLALLGLRPWPAGPETLPAAFKGLAAIVGLLGLAWLFQRGVSAPDLGADLLGPPAVLAQTLAIRVAFCAAAFGLLLLASREDPNLPPAGDGWAWLAALLLLGAAAAHDAPAFCLPLLAGGGLTTAAWAERHRVVGRPGALAAMMLLAALAAAVSWEVSYRWHLRRDMGERYLPLMAPPSEDQLGELRQRVEEFFAGLDLAELAPREPASLEPQDLAFTVWRRSPLARPNARSALAIEGGSGAASVFTFGLASTAASLRRPGVDLEEHPLPMWDGAWVEGRVGVSYRGELWGVARYGLRLRPGYRLPWERELEDIEVALLRGRASGVGEVEGLPGGAVYALYDRWGRALIAPWPQWPPMARELRGEGVRQLLVDTPAGRSWAFPERHEEGWWSVLYLPALTPLTALERAWTHALSVLLVLALGACLALLLALVRPGFRRALVRTLRSYSRRLLLVYATLLLLPLLLLNVALVAGMEQRLWRLQRAEGEAAIESAQQYLTRRLLNLEPGFDLALAFDNDMLAWLSRVIHHEVNLYWGSDEYASSRRELFTAGLLPKRIPGEIYARLALVGYDLDGRTNFAGETPYLELYAPLLPGEDLGEHRFFVSVPLLAQQRGVSEQLDDLRGQALLVSAALLALLIAVGSRLARGFTTPLMELVEGTRRIARGAPSLDLPAPSDLELAALVAAVDDMARRIAEGREKLVREKQVVERMVEHITSGVVSLDAEGRVLMHNRVAAEMMGVAVGRPLGEALARRAEGGALRSFLAAAGDTVAKTTVQLPGGGREWTLAWIPVPGAGEPSALLVVEDVSEVLRAQRLQAWAEMARIIAHEIKNPLTPIRLSAEHMRQVWTSDPRHFDEVFERCTHNILRQVDELRQIASEFSTYSSILRAELKDGDLVAAMAELVESYRAAPPDGVEVELVAPRRPVPARFDARLLGRAVRNLLENAVRASGAGGRVVVAVEAEEGHARVAVRDTGPGVDPALLTRIFDPYFSTHDSGTGLGLPIARRVAEEHGGRISAANHPGGGLEVAITIPLP